LQLSRRTDHVETRSPPGVRSNYSLCTCFSGPSPSFDVPRRSIDELLASAREAYERVTAEEAFRRTTDGDAVLVDTRSPDQQNRQGFVLGAQHHPLSTLLWRLDPDCPTSNEKIPLDREVILICREGYSSSLAAVQLAKLGFERATDVIGGVEAWKGAGLPISDEP
jgi:rhodanese-related sulfurtransferase